MAKSLGLVVMVMLVLSGLAHSESLPDPDDVLADVSSDSERLQQYRQALRNSDPNARLAAFVAMAQTEHPLVRQIAYDEGFASSDMQLRAMALRYSFFDRATFVIHYLDDTTQPVTLQIVEPNQTNGDFKPYGTGGAGSGKVQGLTVEFQFGRCTTSLELNDEDRLVGKQMCSNAETRDVEIDIRG